MTTEEKTTEKKELKINHKLVAIIVGVVIAFIATYFYIDSVRFQSTDDAYIESHMVQIAPKVSGQIIETFIVDNQRVREGDIVAKIENTDYSVKYEKAKAQYEKALLAQNIARANLTSVNSEIENAKKDLERYTNLYKTGAVSKQVLDNAKTKYDTIKARQLGAEQQILSSSKNKVADADLAALKASADQAKLQLEYTNIIAPRDGTVTNKKVEKGAYVQVGQPLFAIVPDEVWVIANFKENQVGKMHVGQSVDIKVDAYPKKTFKGKIDSIQRASGAKSSLFPPENAVGSFVKIVQRIPVKIVFDEDFDKTKYNVVSGMSVVPRVHISEK